MDVHTMFSPYHKHWHRQYTITYYSLLLLMYANGHSVHYKRRFSNVSV